MKRVIFFAIFILTIFVAMPMAVVRVLGNNVNKATQIENHKDTSPKIMVFKKKENKEELMELDEYIVGVVAQEMPADFQYEALKAQAVAARTFAYGRLRNIYGDRDIHKNCDVCTDFAHCQAWIDKKDFLYEYDLKEGKDMWNKLEGAVEDTKDIIIMYQGKVANPLYHSNSGGLTEAAADVWTGVDVPYLKSVASLGEDLGGKYIDNKVLKTNDFLTKIGIVKKYSVKSVLDNISYERSSTGRVKTIKIFGTTKKGTDFRSMFNLCSTNFSIENSNGSINIITHGFGHGVGMSQWGANYLALNGGNYREILKHYYTGIDLELIN